LFKGFVPDEGPWMVFRSVTATSERRYGKRSWPRMRQLWYAQGVTRDDKRDFFPRAAIHSDPHSEGWGWRRESSGPQAADVALTFCQADAVEVLAEWNSVTASRAQQVA
jgi:hypothetical protein